MTSDAKAARFIQLFCPTLHGCIVHKIVHGLDLCISNNRPQISKAPFVSKNARKQEEAEIEAAVAAALEMPVKHRRYLDQAGRAASIEGMVVSRNDCFEA